MLRILIFSMLLGPVTGLHAMSQDPEQQAHAIGTLEWYQYADPAADARAAIKNNDTRLLALATRGINIPGIEQSKQKYYQEKCGVRIMDGISDVIKNDTELEIIKRARVYATEYNKIIAAHCDTDSD